MYFLLIVGRSADRHSWFVLSQHQEDFNVLRNITKAFLGFPADL